MALIQWDDSYIIGIAQIDAEHRNIAQLLSSIEEAMKAEPTREETGKLLDELLECTASHFKSEEKLFLDHQYPQYEEHKKEHDNLRHAASRLQAQVRQGVMNLNTDTLIFLVDWFLNHIPAADKSAASFLRSKGVS